MIRNIIHAYYMATHLLHSFTPSIPRLPPPNRYQRSRNLPNAPLRRQQIELRCRIPCILDLQPHA